MIELLKKLWSQMVFGEPAQPEENRNEQHAPPSIEKSMESDSLPAPAGTRNEEASKATPFIASEKTSPSTLKAANQNLGLNRHYVFDPALKQFLDGYRASEPQFRDPAEAAEWNRHRAKVLHHILSTIQNSECSKNLVLRGSVLLRTWLGEKARLPGDLDWVVTPDSWRLSHTQSEKLCAELLDHIRDTEVDDSIRIPNKQFATDEIWTYEKAPGWRVIVPWEASNPKNNGTVQMDFVFGEILPSPPVETCVLIDELPSINMLTASPEQSLAWKLLWLATDMYAMGKDLYDAVLLAEYTSIEPSLLERTFEVGTEENETPGRALQRSHILDWTIEWSDFISEYPRVSGSHKEWKERLIVALNPVIEILAQSKENPK